MFSSRSRTLAAVAAGVVLLAPLAGCGGGDSKDEAAKKPAATSTSSDTPDASGDVVDGAEFITEVLSAMQDKQTAHMELQLGSSVSASAEVDYASDGTRMQLTLDSGAQTFKAVLADGVMYLQQTAGGKYLKIDKNDPALGSLLTQFGNIGPKASIGSMKAGIKKVVRIGTEKVDGQTLTRYRLTVDGAKAAAAFGVDQTVAGAKGPKTSTFDFFLDSDMLLRRLETSASGQKVVMKVTDWGKPVTIRIPSASEIQN